MRTTLVIVICVFAAVLVAALDYRTDRRRTGRFLAGRSRRTHEQFGQEFFPGPRATVATRVRLLLEPWVPGDASRIEPTDRLDRDLNVDLGNVAEFIERIEENFGLSMKDFRGETIKDIVDFIGERKNIG